MPAPEPEPKSAKPYVIGFLIGAVILTGLPFLQRLFLKAAPPVRALSPWSATSLGGGEVSSTALGSKVVLAMYEDGPCEAECVARQQNFGTAVRHVDDLKETVVVVTLVGEGARSGLAPLIATASPAWRFAVPDSALLAELQDGLNQFLEPKTIVPITRTSFVGSHAVVLIDQNNMLRGFWREDGEGRGNSINAARLLAKQGPNP